jgi:putative hydrolase of the HAD superfamily
MNRYKAVFFDLFYTLINPLDPKFSGESEYKLLGMTREEFESFNALHYEVWAAGSVMDPYEEIELMLRGQGFSKEQLHRAARARMERIRRGLFGVDPEHIALLERLRSSGVKTALISNADCMDIWNWDKSPLRAYFDEAVFSCQAGILKPDPLIYKIALERLKLEAGDCLFAGDGGHDELKGAKAAGLHTALTIEYIKDLWPEKIPRLKAGADYTVEKLSLIEKIVYK